MHVHLEKLAQSCRNTLLMSCVALQGLASNILKNSIAQHEILHRSILVSNHNRAHVGRDVHVRQPCGGAERYLEHALPCFDRPQPADTSHAETHMCIFHARICAVCVHARFSQHLINPSNPAENASRVLPSPLLSNQKRCITAQLQCSRT